MGLQRPLQSLQKTTDELEKRMAQPSCSRGTGPVSTSGLSRRNMALAGRHRLSSRGCFFCDHRGCCDFYSPASCFQFSSSNDKLGWVHRSGEMARSGSWGLGSAVWGEGRGWDRVFSLLLLASSPVVLNTLI